MAKVKVDMRLDEGLLAWADEYARERGSSRTAIVEAAVERFREDCKAGVPELRARAARQSSVSGPVENGVGGCPKRPAGMGHVWKMLVAGADGEGGVRKGDPYKVCEYGCGTLGKEFFAAASAERTALFARLRAPDSVKGTRRAGR